jgi:glutathione S-transferase
MSRFASIAEIRAASGLRMACLRGVPSPWTEAAKGIFHVKQLPCQYGARGHQEPQTSIADWAGDSSVPVVAYEREPLRTGWAEILILAERLRPAPALIPADADQRALLFGLGHEICGEMGLGWSYRLLLIQQSLGHGDGKGFPPAIANHLGQKYGLMPPHTLVARQRVIDILAMLSRRIEGRPYLLGDALSAVDIYWATFANLLTPLPVAELPVEGMIRDAYTCRDRSILDAISPALRAHQTDVYRNHLELPVPL